MSARIEEGKKLIEEARLSEAEHHFEALLKSPAERMEAHLYLAKLKVAAGDPQAAQKHLAVILQANPRQAEALALQGVMAIGSGDIQGGVRLLEKAKAADPEQIVAHLNLAAAYRKLNRLPDSLQAAHEAVQHYPQNALARLHLARTLWQMNKRPEAKESAVAALKIDSTFTPAYLELSNWLVSEGEKYVAISVLQQGAMALPVNFELREKLAHAYLDAGLKEEALKEARGLAENRGFPQDKALLAACEAGIAR